MQSHRRIAQSGKTPICPQAPRGNIGRQSPAGRRIEYCLAILLTLASQSLPHADTVELLNGQRLNGKVLKKNEKEVQIKLTFGNASAEMRYPLSKVHAITIGGVRSVIHAKKSSPGKAGGAGPTSGQTGRTRPASLPDSSARTARRPSKEDPGLSRSEVQAIIDEAGKTQPDWWDSVPLRYPKTLDLSWRNPPKGSKWNPSKNVGQYVWTSINENPRMWKSGTRFMHYVLSINKGNGRAVERAMDALGHFYSDLLEDYARGAFWFQQRIKRGGAFSGVYVGLANCYWKLGSPAMARSVLRKLGSDNTRHGGVIKLWADMGDYDRALRLAKAKASSMPDVAYLAAGETCRRAGDYEKALAFYQKVLEVKSGSRDIKKSKARAQASLQAVRHFDALDIGKVSDGVYESDSIGYSGPVHVQVTVVGGKITDCRVTRHKEKQYYSSITDTTRQIIRKNSVKGVDATSGATITSEAIINATAKALAGGMK